MTNPTNEIQYGAAAGRSRVSELAAFVLRHIERRALWVKLLPVVTLFVFSMTLFPSAVDDDTYISYWSSYSLATFGEIVNYNGERVEQSSSLFHVLLMAVLYKVTGVSMATLGALVSIVAAVLTIIVVQSLASRYVSPLLSIAASFILVTSAFFAFWSNGALETTLTALIVSALVLSIIKYLEQPDSRKIPLGVWLVTPMYLLVRPESVVVIACALIGTLVFHQLRFVLPGDENGTDYKADTRKILYLSAVVILIAAVIFALRYAYFGDLLPQPVSAKTQGLSINKWILGANFLANWITQPPIFAVTFLAVTGGIYVLFRIVRGFRPSTSLLLIALFILAHLAFVASTGGDYMVGARFVVPVIPLAVVMAVITIPHLLKREYVLPVVGAIVAIQIWGLIWFAQSISTGIPLWAVSSIEYDFSLDGRSWFEKGSRPNLRDIPVSEGLDEVIMVIREGNPDTKPLQILSGQMGLVPFYVTQNHYGAVEYMDRWALATSHFTKCEVTDVIPARYDFRWAVPYDFFFQNLAELSTVCGIPRPDIVYEVTDPRWPEAQLDELLESQGYTIVYRQTGEIITNSRFRGLFLNSHQIIAVDNRLAPLFGSEFPRIVRFSE